MEADEQSIEEDHEVDIYSQSPSKAQSMKKKNQKKKEIPRTKTENVTTKPRKTMAATTDMEKQYDYNEAGEKNKFQLYNMVICHSIAVNEELQFVKFLRKVTNYISENPTHAMAKALLDVYGQANFDECDDLVHISSVKILFSEALKFSIDRKRDIVAFDLIQYSK